MDTSDNAHTRSTRPGAGRFATTHWSVVRAAGRPDSIHYRQALETLCRTYWFPLYVYLRRQGYDRESAQEHTQAFFARLLEKHSVRLLPKTAHLFSGRADGGSRKEELAEQIEANSLSSFQTVGFHFCFLFQKPLLKGLFST